MFTVGVLTCIMGVFILTYFRWESEMKKYREEMGLSNDTSDSDVDHEPGAMPGHRNDVAYKAATFFRKRGWFVLFVWVTTLGVSGYWAPDLLLNTELAFSPPQKSTAARANKQFDHLFPEASNVSNLVLLASTTDGSDIRNATREFSLQLNQTLVDWKGAFIYNFESYWSLHNLLEERGVPANLTNALADQLLQQKDGRVAAHPTSTIFVITNQAKVTEKASIAPLYINVWCFVWDSEVIYIRWGRHRYHQPSQGHGKGQPR